MSRLRWPDSTNSVSDVPGTIHLAVRWLSPTYLHSKAFEYLCLMCLRACTVQSMV